MFGNYELLYGFWLFYLWFEGVNEIFYVGVDVGVREVMEVDLIIWI